MRGGGFHDPSRNPNSYPMTGDDAVPERGHRARERRARRPLRARRRSGRLSAASCAGTRSRATVTCYEAGSYGQLLRVPIPAAALADAARSGAVVVRLEVDDALPGGLAIYGASSGAIRSTRRCCSFFARREMNSAVILSEAKDLLDVRYILRRYAPQDDRGKAIWLRSSG